MWLSRRDYWLKAALTVIAWSSALIVLVIIAFLISESIPAIQQEGVAAFFGDRAWYPAEGEFNLTPMLWGTLFVCAGAVVITVPLGIVSAVFIHYFAPSFLRAPYRRMIELLAGIPSVVYGFWGVVVLVPMILTFSPPGTSLLAGIIVLILMTLPTIALAADHSISSVRRYYEPVAASLAFSRATLVLQVVLPAAKGGLVTGSILQTARALGETMAVLMVCGNVVQIPQNLFEPMRALTANIALEMAYAMDVHRSALFVSGLLLMILVSFLVLVSDRVERSSHVS